MGDDFWIFSFRISKMEFSYLFKIFWLVVSPNLVLAYWGFTGCAGASISGPIGYLNAGFVGADVGTSGSMQQSAIVDQLLPVIPGLQLFVPQTRPQAQSLSVSQSPSPLSHGSHSVQQDQSVDGMPLQVVATQQSAFLCQ